MKTNRKGFTITELVIVIVVIAILAAVLIPTFSSLIKKANISADTQMAKNLNTALTMAEASGEEIDEFGEALSAMREAGYLLANLNPTTQGCYLVWESETNQVLLVDGEDNYKVIYHAKDGYGDPDNSWYFAINDKEAAAKVKDDLPNVQIKNTLTTVADFSAALAAGGKQELFVDESIVLDKDNLLKVDNADAEIVVDLGNSSLNTDGILEDVCPIQVTNGKLTLKGGVIGAAGSSYDADGDLVSTPIKTSPGTFTKIEGTEFNIMPTNGYVEFKGDAEVVDATIKTNYLGVHTGAGAKVVLENTNIVSTGRCLWSTNYNGQNHTSVQSVLTVKSGTYHGKYIADANGALYPTVVAYSGDIIIEGGTFTCDSDKMFMVMTTGSIVIKGGTFNGKTLSELGVDGLKDMCAGNYHYNVTVSEGVYTITGG